MGEQRACQVDGCAKVGRMRRGMCVSHYNATRRQEQADVVCKVDGCGRPSGIPGTGLGFCSPHYQRFKRDGAIDAEAHIRPRQHPNTTCSDDGCDRPRRRGRTRCTAHETAFWRAENPDQARAAKHRRRARLASRDYEPFADSEIFERDGWVCQICHEKVDRTKKAPHPRSVSLDHIVPIARGGGHVRTNVQTAHLGCNQAKSCYGGGDQLRLIG